MIESGKNVYLCCKKKGIEMIDNYNPEDFERLKQEVETLVGRSVKTPKDFEFLSRQIEGYTNETISVSTLKRMWGYVASPCKPSKYNLNLLSRMIGYSDWEAFRVETKLCLPAASL